MQKIFTKPYSTYILFWVKRTAVAQQLWGWVTSPSEKELICAQNTIDAKQCFFIHCMSSTGGRQNPDTYQMHFTICQTDDPPSRRWNDVTDKARFIVHRLIVYKQDPLMGTTHLQCRKPCPLKKKKWISSSLLS